MSTVRWVGGGRFPVGKQVAGDVYPYGLPIYDIAPNFAFGDGDMWTGDDGLLWGTRWIGPGYYDFVAACHLELPPRRRPPVTKAVRDLVLTRDSRSCRICGATSDLQVDHVHPWSLGGAHAPTNFRTLCGHCNRREWHRRKPAR